MRKRIVVILLVLCFSFFMLTACTKTKRIEAEVVKISGTLPMLMSSTGAFFGNDSVKLGDPSLVLTLKETGGHIRTLNIADNRGVTKVALLTRICVGSIVSYTVTITGKSEEKIKLDPGYYSGTILADDLLVPVPCMKE